MVVKARAVFGQAISRAGIDDREGKRKMPRRGWWWPRFVLWIEANDSAWRGDGYGGRMEMDVGEQKEQCPPLTHASPKKPIQGNDHRTILQARSNTVKLTARCLLCAGSSMPCSQKDFPPCAHLDENFPQPAHCPPSPPRAEHREIPTATAKTQMAPANGPFRVTLFAHTAHPISGAPGPWGRDQPILTPSGTLDFQKDNH